MSLGKGRSVGADTTGKAASRTPKLRSTDAGSGVPGGPSRDSRMELLFAEQIRTSRLPAPAREYRFAPPRRWRFDFAWTHEVMYERNGSRKDNDWSFAPIAVEVEGGTYIAGRHSRGKGYEKDTEKYNRALIMGWRVLRVTSAQVEDGRAIGWLKELFRA